MKRFLIQILYFTLTVACLAFLFSGLNLHLIRKKILNPENFRLSDSTTMLIIGDSYVGLSLNPKYIKGANNETVLGEHYLYSYTRLKYFLENNPQLEYIVLSFNYSTIAAPFDRGLLDGRNQSFFFGKEFMLLGKEELKFLRTNNLVYIRNFLAWKLGVPSKENLSLIKQTMAKNFKRNALPFRGEYIDCGNLSYVDNYQLNVRLKECFEPDKEQGLSPLILEYLQKIAALCEQSNVKLVLYTSPLSNLFFNAIPVFYKEEFQKTCQELPKSVFLLDYARYQLPDSCFEDVNHLNGIGAKIISSRLLDDLKKLEQDSVYHMRF
ncbi:MAG: hypothetical protein LBJ17_07590 [Dysgonamonadaceae bacterium]|jgi:hypothetical protein|nr:hypothetical protein [Dysgonamonadaceae bacterium]